MEATGGLSRIVRYHLQEGKVVPTGDTDQVYRFAWIEEDEVCFSEWRLDGSKLVNNRLRSTLGEASELAQDDRRRRSLAWLMYRLERWSGRQK
jgi:hypothetical protein